MSQETFHSDELDKLLDDIHNLLDDEPVTMPSLEETAEPTELPPEEELPEEPAEKLPEEQPEPEDVPVPEVEFEASPEDEEPAEQEEASSEKFHTQRWTDRQKLPKHVAKLQQNQEEAYAQWLAEHPEDSPEDAPDFDAPVEEKPKKKHSGLLAAAIILLCLAIAAAAAVVFALPDQPVADNGLERKPETSTILLAGLDDGGRTDALMLLNVDKAAGQLSLVSIPCDTLVQEDDARIPKLRFVYGMDHNGQSGVEELLLRVKDCIGFRPDGYVMMNLSQFADFLSAAGGLELDGSKLDSTQAQALLRAGTEEERMQMQRKLVVAAAQQFTAAAKAPSVLGALTQNAATDLTGRELMWLALGVRKTDLDNVQTAILPGDMQELANGSYYVLDEDRVLEQVNAQCSPYTQAISSGDLNIRTE